MASFDPLLLLLPPQPFLSAQCPGKNPPLRGTSSEQNNYTDLMRFEQRTPPLVFRGLTRAGTAYNGVSMRSLGHLVTVGLLKHRYLP